MKYTAKFIDNALNNKYLKSAKYLVSNIYGFNSYYGETDFLVVNENGYCYDIEIKVSRGDFKADFKKKRRHSILEFGSYRNHWDTFIKSNPKDRKSWIKVPKHKDIIIKEYPNRFYYAVPEGLITKEEVPKYAGLIYINEKGEFTKVKEAKLLHKTKINIEKLLCRKFYFRMLNYKNKLEKLQKSK